MGFYIGVIPSFLPINQMMDVCPKCLARSAVSEGFFCIGLGASAFGVFASNAWLIIVPLTQALVIKPMMLILHKLRLSISRAISLFLWVIFFVHFWAEQAVGQSHLRNSTFLTICEKIFWMGKLMVIVKVLSGFMRPFSICWKVEVLQRENPSSLFILLVLMLLPGKQFFCTVLRALDLKGDILQILSSL